MSTITKWRAREFLSEIKRVECARETDVSVFVAVGNGAIERREAKESRGQKYCNSWDEAHAYLLRLAEARVQSARFALDRANGALGNIKGMKKPQ